MGLACSRDQEIEYAPEHGIPVSVTKKKPYILDKNLWGLSIECGVLEDPWVEPPEDIFTLTTIPRLAPDKAEEIEVGFECGVPVTLNGEDEDLVVPDRRAQPTRRPHGVGVPTWSRTASSASSRARSTRSAGSLALIQAHTRARGPGAGARDLLHFKLGPRAASCAELSTTASGSPLNEASTAFVVTTQELVTGDIRLRFLKGSCVAAGRRSEYRLYDYNLATYDAAEDEFRPQAAKGFIDLWGLPIKVWARVGKEHHMMKELEDDDLVEA